MFRIKNSICTAHISHMFVICVSYVCIACYICLTYAPTYVTFVHTYVGTYVPQRLGVHHLCNKILFCKIRSYYISANINTFMFDICNKILFLQNNILFHLLAHMSTYVCICVTHTFSHCVYVNTCVYICSCLSFFCENHMSRLAFVICQEKCYQHVICIRMATLPL